MSDLMFKEEVAEALRVPEHTLSYWVQTGAGPKSFKLGRRRVYKREDVEAWVEAQYAAASTRDAS